MVQGAECIHLELPTGRGLSQGRGKCAPSSVVWLCLHPSSSWQPGPSICLAAPTGWSPPPPATLLPVLKSGLKGDGKDHCFSWKNPEICVQLKKISFAFFQFFSQMRRSLMLPPSHRIQDQQKPSVRALLGHLSDHVGLCCRKEQRGCGAATWKELRGPSVSRHEAAAGDFPPPPK